MGWDHTKRTAHSPEAQETHDPNGKGDKMTTEIGEYEMDQVILDLGSDVNMLPKQTLECMGWPML